MDRIRLPVQRLEAQFAAADGDRESRTVPMVFYSGAKVMQFSCENGVHELTLSMEPAHVRLEQLQSGRAPFTLGHASPNDPASTIGVIDNARIEAGKARADVRFSKRPEVDAILADVLDGIMANVSVGARLHRIKETTQEGYTMRSFVSTDWEPFAVALVGVGADPGAHFAAIDGETTDCEIEFHERPMHEYDQQQ